MDNFNNKADIKVGQVWMTTNGDYVKVLSGADSASTIVVRDLDSGIECTENRRNLLANCDSTYDEFAEFNY